MRNFLGGTEIHLDVGSMVTGTDSNALSVHFTDTTTPVLFKVTVVDSINNQYSKLTINGNLVDSSLVSVGLYKTTIDNTALTKGDIVDLEFLNNNNSNSSNNGNIPTLWTANSGNKTFNSFTISETSAHWQDIMFNIPGFDGTAFGENNYSQITRLNSYGGKIFLHNDNGILHDLQYADKTLNITGALFEQGKDYDSFIIRFRNQVRRLYKTKAYASVSEIVKDALTVLLANKKGGQLYATSNMAYSVETKTQKELLDTGQTPFKLDYIPNGDTNIRDHVYVWLTDNMNSDDVLVRRMLVKDIDYTIVGNTLNIITAHNAMSTGAKPAIDVEFYDMDTPCYIPQSMVKLGLKFGTQPQVVNNKLLTHDGNSYDLASGAELYKIDSMTFDPVNAAQFELELMIYNGLVKNDTLYTDAEKYTTIDNFMPSQHRGTWYTLDNINDYVYSYFSKWARRYNINPLIEESVYDANDSTTWNYKDMSSTILADYNDLCKMTSPPGHYVGIYHVLFGTHQPHINPWHMLGFSYKPTWWNTYYSWTDATKRTALLDALQKGTTSKPGDAIVQNPNFARYAWDWINKCPVDTSGALVDPKLILGEPSAVEAAKPFVFGDWGPTEQQYRFGAECYSVTVDAMLKLLPAKAFTYFFHPGVIDYTTITPLSVDRLNNKTLNAKTFIQPGLKPNKVLTKINVESQQYGYSTTSHNTKIYGSEYDTVSQPVVTFDANGFVTSIALNKRLYNIDDEAVLKSNVLKKIIDPTDPLMKREIKNIELEYIYSEAEYVANGVSQALYNYAYRNNYTVDQIQHTTN